jgi:SecD/SecF fusion protein
MLWKEREPVYRARLRRIRDALGHVPAYAVATAGAPVDVEPGQARRGAVSVTAPQDPTQVSRDEFDDLVRNLGIDEAPAARKPAAAAAGRPAGGRRARARGNGGDAPGSRAAGADPPARPPTSGEQPGKPKKQRNRRHGRPR